jgi:hypothetical protein
VTDVVEYIGNWKAFAWNDWDNPPHGYTTDDAEPEDVPCCLMVPCAASLRMLQPWTATTGVLRPSVGALSTAEPMITSSSTRIVEARAASSAGLQIPNRLPVILYRKAEGIDIQRDRTMRFVAKEDRN